MKLASLINLKPLQETTHLFESEEKDKLRAMYKSPGLYQEFL